MACQAPQIEPEPRSGPNGTPGLPPPDRILTDERTALQGVVDILSERMVESSYLCLDYERNLMKEQTIDRVIWWGAILCAFVITGGGGLAWRDPYLVNLIGKISFFSYAAVLFICIVIFFWSSRDKA
jgi:hypothetical protein